ncbi:hypothetical protein IC216_02355 [Clostridioides sp. ES-S-0145-01]|uniref:hypothetical protein n=1 Tax=unclassified Clostridioides TaxID=2635829 RepID=UPI001D0FC7AE|nr:hypothetical protein [Clostridioides sp. ES-S-0145-01]UDN56756.1 hypothetical protein JJC01_11220 [Clostridioides sp. ES-S-0010-02]
MELKLNIYSKDNKNKIEKTYTTDTVNIMFGTIEDIFEIVDIEKINNNEEIVKTVIKGLKLLKPFLKNVFDDLTDDELRQTNIKELVVVFVEIFKYTFNEIMGMPNSKN